ncbi:MAG TPA: DUF1343 domain-containing protein, partial [Planctomycetota bacterium]|nr:DUF1343 domain-containing protein [Planctomycetota bacterium]
RSLASIVDLIARIEGVELVAIFGPEHGFRGAEQAGDKVGDARDPRTGVPVHSLYGATRRPTPEMLEGIDVILFDIQDVGVRAYTYLSTLVEVLHAAKENGVEVWVLDRPVPTGADRIEGPILEAGRESFVGAHMIPLRHGLTAGEFALLVDREREIGASPRIVRMENYRRDMTWEETGIPWVAPSPNIPTVDIALIYAGMVLIEGTNLSEGRGTTRPFQLVGAPWIDGARLAEELRALELPGVLFREAWFTPTFSKHDGKACQGVEIHVTDRRAYRSVRTALEVIAAVRRFWPEDFRFRESGFDRLAGTAKLREALLAGTPPAEIESEWEASLEAWRKKHEGLLLYR